MASEPIEGFQEVNLASPTTPDMHVIAELGTQKSSTPPSTLYRTHSLSSTVCVPTTLDIDQLPTQPVYPDPTELNTDKPHNGSLPELEAEVLGATYQEAGSGDWVASVGDDGEDLLGLNTDSISHLRSPSVMEVREKGYERLKEELAKAQQERGITGWLYWICLRGAV